VAEPLAPTFWWNAGGEIGHESGYEPLKWNPVNDAFCPTEGEPSAHGPRCEFWQKNQRILFTPVLAPQAGYFGAGGASPGRIARYSIASYYIPAGYDRQSRRVTGAVHLHSSQGEEAPGAKLELRVYVNDDLKLIRTIASQKEAVTFAAEVGRLSAGDRIQVAFGAGALGDQGGFWFDYKVELQPSGKASLPETLPVADAFRVDTATPIEENTGWTARHYQLCAMAGTNEIDLLFVGDSVTAGWDGSGKGVWDKQVQRYHPANFGISGEGTQDVLWRITHRELDGLDPKVVVVLLGSNDINWPSAQIAGGVAEVVRKIRARLPHSRVFLMGILPRGEQPNTIERVRALEANAQLQKLDAGRQVQYFYFGDKLLLPDGRMTRETAPDFLHPREGGYQFWMESIRPGIEKALGVKLHPNG
jgi:lysophospholipase L1-like esterase